MACRHTTRVLTNLGRERRAPASPFSHFILAGFSPVSMDTLEKSYPGLVDCFLAFCEWLLSVGTCKWLLEGPDRRDSEFEHSAPAEHRRGVTHATQVLHLPTALALAARVMIYKEQ